MPLLLTWGACYLVGSIPTAYLFAKLARGVDIRTVGSGNVGATNAFRTIGAWAGVSVFVICSRVSWHRDAFPPGCWTRCLRPWP